ncbi:MAG: oligopeptide transporter, OPT family [Bacteroidales bacterium]|nr:oligopeptide transporter, OPT family [Bacteroidales bacterium]
MDNELEKPGGLPENAFRPLKPEETYKPIIPDNEKFKGVNVWSVGWGLVMAVIFSAAAAYLGLKVGQVFEAAIPIAIIAVGLSNAGKRKNKLAENVMIQSIGACSGVIVAGAIFTLPALYILQAKYPELTVNFINIFLSSLLGGILGILFLIPFRKYFVSEMHGQYPFPEATATAQVLVSSEQGGGQAKPLVIAGIIGGVYDFIIATFGWWNENFSSRVIPFGETIAQKTKAMFNLNVGAAVVGLGYIVGLKYCAIITFGSLFIWWVVDPIMNLLFFDQVLAFGNPDITATVGSMSAEQIYSTYGRQIGIGAIAMAGLIGIWNSRGVIKSAGSLAAKEFKVKDNSKVENVKRTERDLSMKFIAIASVVVLIAILIFFWIGVIHNLWQAIIAWLVVTIIAFLFTTVAATAIAIVGSNPVSGMTLMTLILASVILVSIGLKGTSGMVAALVIGGVVCTALSMAGGFITDLKVGYWTGVTPKAQESWKFLGTLVSAATVGGVILILNQTFGFTSGKLAAPQASAMAAVIEPLMSGAGAPWALYGIGAIIALILFFIKVPPLAFALGMFIPIGLNLPLLVGGAINWFVGSRSKNKELNTARVEKGNLLASGFIAGGALMGVISALMSFKGWNFVNEEWLAQPDSQWLGLGMYILLLSYFTISTMKVKK